MAVKQDESELVEEVELSGKKSLLFREKSCQSGSCSGGRCRRNPMFYWSSLEVVVVTDQKKSPVKAWSIGA